MKALGQRLYTSPKYAKAFHWGKLITIVGLAQLLIQAISLLSGIVIIRLLPNTEYALYTLANTMLATMITLADGGISSAVMAQSGRVWHNSGRVGLVLATGFDLRKKFAISSLVIAVPVLLLLLHYHGSSWMMSMIITISLIPVFFTTLYGHLLEIIPKLNQDIGKLQKIQIGSNIARLVMLYPVILFFPWAFVAIFITSLPQIWANRRLHKISFNLVNWHQKSDLGIRKEILSFIKLSLPNAIYFSISGQVMIWLISIFGSTQAIAQVGALSRLALVLMIFNILFATLISPRFSKLPVNHKVLLSRYLQIQIALIALSAIIISIVFLFPKPLLWILGQGYADLSRELILTIIGSCLNLIVGSSITLYTSRGWIMKPIISIGANVVTIILGALLINVSTLKGILLFNIFQAFIGLIMHFTFGVIMIKKSKSYA